MKLIIQIPCYNEAETLEIALNDLQKKINGIGEIEYLIIDDGCKDNTVEELLMEIPGVEKKDTVGLLDLYTVN